MNPSRTDGRVAPTIWMLLIAWGVLAVALPTLAQPTEAPAPPAAETETGDAEQAPVDDSGPRGVFETAKQAYNDRDWPAFVACVSPVRRDELIGQFALSFALQARQPDANPGFAQIVERHLPDDVDPEIEMESEDIQAEYVRLAKRMRDPMGFFAEAYGFLLEYEFQDEADQVKLTELTEVVVNEEGTGAAGKVTTVTPNGQRVAPWSFEMHEGRWYLSMRQ